MPTPLPVVHQKDGGMAGRGSDYAYTCFACRHGRRCIERLKITTEDSTACQFEPSRFEPHPSVPLEWPDEPPKKRQRKWSKPQFENPEQFQGPTPED